ncbi:P-loop NTPase [Haploplasma axanthum]|uniref:Iron-sulfur cluster carrier protein n=1 Tax=Haploplasma axanthum TaxID=29552 RepID=A0A449BF33_HAPAX|nr:P-loop NTPase [Haploplasma axanthum]VEU81074.1 Cell division inhibitor MinD [Haploplasma axanthum]
MEKIIIDKISEIIDKQSKKTLKELDAIKRVTILSNNVVDIEIEIDDILHQDHIKREVAKIVKLELKYPGVKIEIKGKENEVLSNEEEKNKVRYIAIASGKGGVGKSTVTANLANALSKLGKKVGIIDVDIYGASIPFIFGMEIKPLDLDSKGKIIPARYENLEIISTEFFVPKDKPLMWRAPIASQMTEMFFESVSWQQELDFIIIDMPPGTGDIAIDVRELVPKSEMIIVTNPNVSAANIAVKAGLGSRELGHNIKGVIENMSFYYNACSKEKEYLFGEGGGSLVAEKLGVDLLAQIPITKPNDFDNLYDYNGLQGKTYLLLAKKFTEENNG